MSQNKATAQACKRANISRQGSALANVIAPVSRKAIGLLVSNVMLGDTALTAPYQSS